jgi:hypothetical protein
MCILNKSVRQDGIGDREENRARKISVGFRWFRFGRRIVKPFSTSGKQHRQRA